MPAGGFGSLGPGQNWFGPKSYRTPDGDGSRYHERGNEYSPEDYRPAAKRSRNS